MTIALSSALKAAKNAPASTYAWLYLLDVEVDPDDSSKTLYLARSTENVTFAGTEYTAFAFDLGATREDVEGNLTGLDIQFTDISGNVRDLLRDWELEGKKVTVRIVESNNLASATDQISETFRIKSWTASYDSFVFHLDHQNLMNRSFPGRKLHRTRCGWKYKGSECGYTGALPSCDFTLDGANGCRTHTNVARFGGAPAIPRTRLVV